MQYYLDHMRLQAAIKAKGIAPYSGCIEAIDYI